jgi:hypothetical protein
VSFLKKLNQKLPKKPHPRPFFYKVLVNLFQKVAGFGAEPQGFDFNFLTMLNCD